MGQILDRIDIVVRRRGDQRHAGRGVPHLGDLFGHLVARQLPAFARLGALGHLDLQHLGVGQVVDRHAEPPAGHLLDRAIGRIAVGQRQVTPGIFTPFARVRHAAEPVHGHSHGLVGLFTDRAVRHGAGIETSHDARHRFDLAERHGLAFLELEQTPQGA